MTDTIENQEKHLYHMLIKMLYCGWLINKIDCSEWLIDSLIEVIEKWKLHVTVKYI